MKKAAAIAALIGLSVALNIAMAAPSLIIEQMDFPGGVENYGTLISPPAALTTTDSLTVELRNVMRGDLNHNGRLDVGDLAGMKRILRGAAVSPWQYAVADVDGDGAVTQADDRLLRSLIPRKIRLLGGTP